MAIEECPHCISKVMFPENGKCPSCGESKYVRAQKSREEIIFHQEKEDLKENIEYAKKKTLQLLISGTSVFGLSLFFTVWTTIYANVIIWFYGGIIAGGIMIYKGWLFLANKKKLNQLLKSNYK